NDCAMRMGIRAILMGAFLASACGSSSSSTGSDGAAGSDGSVESAGSGRVCLVSMSGALTNCREYSSDWSETDLAKDCSASMRVRAASCPAAGVVGTCVNATVGGQIPALDVKYYSAQAATAQ